MSAPGVPILRERLADRRSGQVVVVSHCLLNQNVRYLGGATRAGVVGELVDLLEEAGVGIVHMPCPEQAAWGGVLKPRLLRAYGARRQWWFRYKRTLLWFGIRWTRHVYSRQARRLVSEIRDYRRAGIEVLAVIGVGGSVRLDLHADYHIARWRPVAQWVLAIPQLMVAGALGSLRSALTLISLVTVLFTEQIPRPIFDAIAMCSRGRVQLRWHLPALRAGYTGPAGRRRAVVLSDAAGSTTTSAIPSG